MSYNVDELFGFRQCKGGYSLDEYNQKDNIKITEIEIPAEYNGLPVVGIGSYVFGYSQVERVVIPDTVTWIADNAFATAVRLKSVYIPDTVTEIGNHAFGWTDLRSVVLPKSLEFLDDGAFACCSELKSVTFNSAPKFGWTVFKDCPRLPADVTLMGLVGSFDITAPLDKYAYNICFEKDWSEDQYGQNIYARPDVFELALKNDCFRSVDISLLLKFLVEAGFTDRLICAEKYGMLDTPALLGELTEYSVRQGRPEVTAYLLDLKNRKFGFAKEDNYDL